jgi:dTDP-4-amino-4,6-dideoxygalactose transaminase
MTALAALTEHRWPPRPTEAQRDALATAYRSLKWTEDPYTEAVEHHLRRITGALHAVAFNSCTSALHAALIAHGAASHRPLYTPAFGFAGTVTGAAHLKTPVYWLDSDPDTGNPAPVRLPSGALALIPDLHGLPHAWDRDNVITDSCQSLGTRVDGQYVGEQGTHCWSFSATKLVSAPDGGAVTTNDPAIRDRLRQLRDYGTEPDGPRATRTVTALGHNWRPSALSMAVIAPQLEPATFADTARRARATTAYLTTALQEAGWWTPAIPPGIQPAWHKIRTRAPGMTRDHARQALAEHGVPTHLWGTVPLPDHPVFAERTARRTSIVGARHLADTTFCLGTEQCPPWTWTDTEIAHVVHVIDTL